MTIHLVFRIPAHARRIVRRVRVIPGVEYDFIWRADPAVRHATVQIDWLT